MPITHPEREPDFQLIFNKETFNVSKCLFGLYSHIFRQHPSFVFHESLDMSEKGITNDAFKEFIKACQGRFYTININNCFGLLKLSEKWEVNVVKKEVSDFISNIDDASADIMKLKFYLLQSNPEFFNEVAETKRNSHEKKEKHSPKKEKSRMEIINHIEDSISKNINFYLDIPSFAELPISCLLRIISKSFSYNKSLNCKNKKSQNENSDETKSNKNDDNDAQDVKNENINNHLFLKFLESATNYHKEASRVLVKLVDNYGDFTESELKRLNEVANPFSELDFTEKIRSFFTELDAQNKEINEFQKDLSAIKKEGEKSIKKIEAEVKTLKHTMKKNAKNSPSTSKSLSNLTSVASGEDPGNSPLNPNSSSTVLSNSLSNLELASRSTVPSDSELEEHPSSPNKHNLHPMVPIPPNRPQPNQAADIGLSNYDILESLTDIMNKFNQIKNSSSSFKKSIDFYDNKIAEFKDRCDQINAQLSEEEAKAKAKPNDDQKSKAKQKQKQKPQSQIEKAQSQIEKAESKAKTKSLSNYAKSTEKVSIETPAKSSKHSSKESKSKGKEKPKNSTSANQESNDINSISVPKANFQTIKETKSRHSHSVKEPDRVSFTDVDQRKRSFFMAKSSITSPSSPQSHNQSSTAASITVADNINKKPITILFNQEDLNGFNGIIHYLCTLNASGNLNGIMSIQASSTQTGIAQPENIVKANGIWLSDDKENQWISFDFISRKINVLNYSIKTIPYGENSFHMKNWAVEGSNSNDNDGWVLLDKRENNSQLASNGVVINFNVNLCQNQFFRYIRLKMIGPNHFNSNVFAFSRIEFYGTLKIGD